MNKIVLLIIFYLKKGAGKGEEGQDEVKMLLNCLHPNERCNKYADEHFLLI